MRARGWVMTWASVWILLCGALACMPLPVDAAEPERKPNAAPKARARSKPKLRVNLPKGWQWPPTAKMRQDGRRCLRDLDRLEVSWKPARATRQIVTPVVVEDMTFGGVRLVSRYRKAPHVMDCHLARALARHVGPALRNMKVREMRFGQIHDYREVAGKKGVLSRHALGLAMDVYSFVTDDGEVHVVHDDYLDGNEVLLEIERRVTDTGAFRMLLTPGNDPERHYDHFHFEARAAGDKVVSQPTRDPAADDSDTTTVAGSLHP
jgi:hypothetical protein